MNLDDLDKQWRATNEVAATKEQREQLIATTCRRVERFWGQIVRRDLRESIPAVVMIVFFGWCMLGAVHVVAKVGDAILIVWCLFIIWKLYRTRTIERPAPLDAPVQEFCRIEISRMDRQIQLLRNVLWWYIAPCLIGVNMVFIGSIGSKAGIVNLGVAALVYFVSTSLLSWWIYSLNMRAVSKHLLPAREELTNTLSQLSGAEPETLGRVELPVERSPKLRHPVAMLVLTVAMVSLAAIAAVFVFPTSDSERPDPQQHVAPTPASATPAPITPEDKRLKETISDIRREKELVGLAAMVMVDGKVVASAADGERKLRSDVPVETGDRWHLGGITKSITATMIARLIESGQLNWSDTIGERFPNAAIHEEWKPVTLRQLLTDTSGAPASFSVDVLQKRPALGAECTKERRAAVLDVMAVKPANPPGEKYLYSNVGYTIAAAMAEVATGMTWEDLVKREVFAPLNLHGAGFGPPKSPAATLDQPRGHRSAGGVKVSVNDDVDNTPIMGPAGSLHMTLSDLCNYATDHLRGELGAGTLLASKTYQQLHRPAIDRFACGWVEKQPTDEIPHTLFWHNGSNTLWFALVVFIPDKKMVIAVTSNDGDIEQADSVAWQIVKQYAGAVKVEAPDDPK